MSDPTSFMIRKKADGSLDSICLTCFETIIAPSDPRSEMAIRKADERHVCKANVFVHRDLYEPQTLN